MVVFRFILCSCFVVVGMLLKCCSDVYYILYLFVVAFCYHYDPPPLYCPVNIFVTFFLSCCCYSCPIVSFETLKRTIFVEPRSLRSLVVWLLL